MIFEINLEILNLLHPISEFFVSYNCCCSCDGKGKQIWSSCKILTNNFPTDRYFLRVGTLKTVTLWLWSQVQPVDPTAALGETADNSWREWTTVDRHLERSCLCFIFLNRMKGIHTDWHLVPQRLNVSKCFIAPLDCLGYILSIVDTNVNDFLDNFKVMLFHCSVYCMLKQQPVKQPRRLYSYSDLFSGLNVIWSQWWTPEFQSFFFLGGVGGGKPKNSVIQVFLPGNSWKHYGAIYILCMLINWPPLTLFKSLHEQWEHRIAINYAWIWIGHGDA